ncbi:hypothetical protein H4582DRAFT_2056807 [Lactarius indigo]|nr:hypothetical protein H4582DRAFT_2056807 [Lactarius indigo]
MAVLSSSDEYITPGLPRWLYKMWAHQPTATNQNAGYQDSLNPAELTTFMKIPLRGDRRDLPPHRHASRQTAPRPAHSQAFRTHLARHTLSTDVYEPSVFSSLYMQFTVTSAGTSRSSQRYALADTVPTFVQNLGNNYQSSEGRIIHNPFMVYNNNLGNGLMLTALWAAEVLRREPRGVWSRNSEYNTSNVYTRVYEGMAILEGEPVGLRFRDVVHRSLGRVDVRHEMLELFEPGPSTARILVDRHMWARIRVAHARVRIHAASADDAIVVTEY